MSTEAELLANLPADGVRVYKRIDDPFWYRAVLPNNFWHATHPNRGWFDNEAPLTDPAELLDTMVWEDITPTPTLPDPSGDLPDGTRVRVTYEGTAREWTDNRGRVELDNGHTLGYQYEIGRDGGTVEALPTLPPSALDGEPGSLWRDPEYGTTWARVCVTGSNVMFRQVSGPHTAFEGQLLSGYGNGDHATIARLVPAQVADDE